jgi:5-methylcytosine-specific restriction enzyme subunit McrC
MASVSIFEFDALASSEQGPCDVEGVHAIPARTFAWMEAQCLRASQSQDVAWLRLTQRSGRRAIQLTSFVGVIRAPDGFQIEVLPKLGKAIEGGKVEARRLLVEMLCCLEGFRHIQTHSASLKSAHMPLLEIFIAEFLRTVERIVKGGLRASYSSRQDNLFALRGKLLIGENLRSNLYRADRVFSPSMTNSPRIGRRID